MHFRIIEKHDFERKTRISKILWKKSAFFYKKLIGGVTFIGLIFMALGVASPYTFYREVAGSGIYYNLNLMFSIGLAVLFFALMCFQFMRIHRKTFFQRDEDKRSSESWLREKDLIIEIDEEAIRTDSENLKQEIRWPLISRYMLKDDILFLSTSNYCPYILTIDIRDI